MAKPARGEGEAASDDEGEGEAAADACGEGEAAADAGGEGDAASDADGEGDLAAGAGGEGEGDLAAGAGAFDMSDTEEDELDQKPGRREPFEPKPALRSGKRHRARSNPPRQQASGKRARQDDQPSASEWPPLLTVGDLGADRRNKGGYWTVSEFSHDTM